MVRTLNCLAKNSKKVTARLIVIKPMFDYPIFSLIIIGFWGIIVMGCLWLWAAHTWFIGRVLNLVPVFWTICIWWVLPSFKIFLNISKMVYESLKWYSRSATLSLTSILVFNAPSAYCVGCVYFSLLHVGI